MRLGGPLFGPQNTPDQWIATLRKHGYGAAYCPDAIMRSPNDQKLIDDFLAAAKAADVVIAEVGAWSNPMSPDEAERNKNIRLCQDRLALAERVGTRCCVNISGSRGKNWAGPHPLNLSQETFDLVVETTRKIIDAVKPTRTYYTLEMMQWVFPDSADSYVALMKAIDRKAFAVHLDPVNIINCPSRFYDTGKVIRECFAKLGPHVRSCHAKDIILREQATVHLDECRPGTGGLDYTAYLTELARLDPDVPLMLEHLSGEEPYKLSAHHIREVAQKAGVSFVGPKA